MESEGSFLRAVHNTTMQNTLMDQDSMFRSSNSPVFKLHRSMLTSPESVNSSNSSRIKISGEALMAEIQSLRLTEESTDSDFKSSFNYLVGNATFTYLAGLLKP